MEANKLEAGLMNPGPTRYAADQLRKQRGSRGLLKAVGEPMSYSPNPLIAALGGAALGAQYLTGEADPTEGAKSLSDMTAMAVGSRLPAPIRNIITYHGSPHKFDKFDSSKIGTGEGAQAYGHGLYLAEAPEVASSYSGGKRLTALQMTDGVQRPAGNLYKVDLPDSAVAKMLDWDKPLSQQTPEAQAIIRQKLQAKSPKLYETWSQNGALEHAPLGSWFNELAPNTRAGVDARAALSESLRSAGIPGIRYLDGGSRGGNSNQWLVTGPTGMVRAFPTEREAKKALAHIGGKLTAPTATSNFVVFPGEEGMLKILERNGNPLVDALSR
jgi:hypothetical protein